MFARCLENGRSVATYAMVYNAVAMLPEQIAAALEPFVGLPLSAAQIDSVSKYLDLLLKWNAKLNLTSIREPQAVVARHFGESLFAAQQLFPEALSDQSVIDIGSGAGFPGLPIKIWRPNLRLTLIESNQRKATFLREVVRSLGLGDIVVLAQRAEVASVSADLVTLRAVEKFDSVLPIASTMTNTGGRLAILIGVEQIVTAKKVLPTVSWDNPIPVPKSRSRVLLAGRNFGTGRN